MAARCSLTNKGRMIGHQVSHSQRKSKKAFKVNLQEVSLYSQALSQLVRIRVAVSTLRSIDKNGGIDTFLLETSNLKLTEEAISLKKKILKSLEGSKAANTNAKEETKQSSKKAAA